MSASSKKIQNTKRIILESAEKLFMKYGIKKVTIQDIASEAGISKMTFYRSYSNKEEVALHVIQSISAKYMEKYQMIMSKPIPFPERIQAFIFLKSEGSKDFSPEFIKDVHNLEASPLLDEIHKLQIRSREIFMEDLRKAKEEGHLRSDVKLEMISYLINDMSSKINDEIFLSLFKDLAEASEQLMKHFFNGILPAGSQL
jgi:AcrR family transcriptional regulator